MKRIILKSRVLLLLFLTLFILAQVSWWLVFQIRSGERMKAHQREIWQQEIHIAQIVRSNQFPGNSHRFSQWLESHYGHLVLREEGSIAPSDEALAQLEAQTSRTVRMFAMEGAFFAVVVLMGVVFLYRRMRHETLLQRQHATFIAAVSHELKTPLTGLRLMNETLLLRPLDREQALTIHENMQENLNRLEQLVEHLLATRLIGERQLLAARSLHNVSQLTLQTIAELKTRLPREDLERLHVSVEENLHSRLIPEQWSLVVSNLLGNALKYSQRDQAVELQLHRVGSRIKLIVRDRGIGFPNRERKKIFTMFYRLDASANTEGMGMGLYLVREIVRSFGGSVHARSAGQGRGAVFIVTLPLKKEPSY